MVAAPGHRAEHPNVAQPPADCLGERHWDDAFVDLMVEVRESDRESMPGANVWLSPALREATIVADAEHLWRQVRSEGSFKDMVYGDSIPDDAEVLECLASIGASLVRI